VKLTLISVGKDKSKLFQPAVSEYLSRLARWAKVEVFELAPSAGEGERAKADEAARIQAKVSERDTLVALDERGKLLTSVEFARFVADQRDRSRDVAFVVGGDEGLHATLLQRAALTLSLSKMTLPHRMARMVLAEQLYRAFSINAKEPYHK
jgi:23S rRNA (pseudouridine1915-N3)-methyltransferase